MSELYCKHCGASFMRQALLALLIDFGARGSDPTYCPYGPDNEHEFVSEEKLKDE